MKVEPSPGVLSTLMAPPCLSMMEKQIERPSPVPTPTPLVVKPGSKIRACTSAGIPGPPAAPEPMERETVRENAPAAPRSGGGWSR